MHELNITTVFNFIMYVLGNIVGWMQSNYIVLGTIRVSFFDIEVAALVLATILINIPVFVNTFYGGSSTLYDDDDFDDDY